MNDKMKRTDSVTITRNSIEGQKGRENAMKKIAAVMMAIALMAAVAVPAYAKDFAGLETSAGYGSQIYEGTFLGTPARYSRGTAPYDTGWVWINGYCYYYPNVATGDFLKSTTTPDGYQVDAEGHWVKDGVAQHDGYGSYVMGTDALYAGKDDEARWDAMQAELEKVYADTTGKDNNLAMMSHDSEHQNSVYWGYPYRTITIIHDDGTNEGDEYISAWFANYWTDMMYNCAPGSCYAENIEKTLKILLGDHTGQEFFNDLRAAADPAEGGARLGTDYSTGKTEYYTDEYGAVHYKTVVESVSGDGVNFNKFPLSKWNGRKTDYGKTITITTSGTRGDTATKTPESYTIHIN